MPLYRYEVIGTGLTFEIERPMSAPTLTEHPTTGWPIRRVYDIPNLGVHHTTGGEKRIADDRFLERKGFTKYVRDRSDDTFHRTVGQAGPEVLKP